MNMNISNIVTIIPVVPGYLSFISKYNTDSALDHSSMHHAEKLRNTIYLFILVPWLYLIIFKPNWAAEWETEEGDLSSGWQAFTLQNCLWAKHWIPDNIQEQYSMTDPASDLSLKGNKREGICQRLTLNQISQSYKFLQREKSQCFNVIRGKKRFKK